MVIRGRRPLRTVQRGRRRKLVWARTASTLAEDGVTVAAGASDLQDLLASFQAGYGADVLGSTVMRIRGAVSISQGTVANDIIATMGIGVFPETLAVAEMHAFNNIHLDWMYWETVFASPANIPASDFSQVHNHVLDVRSKRKLDELQDGLFWNFANVSASSVNYRAAFSVLLALP